MRSGVLWEGWSAVGGVWRDVCEGWSAMCEEWSATYV